MSELEPIELEPPREHTISYGAISALAAYIVTHEAYFLIRTRDLQEHYNEINGMSPNKYQGIRLLTHATAMVQKEVEGPLPLPPVFSHYSEDVWRYVSDAYEARVSRQQVA